DLAGEHQLSPEARDPLGIRSQVRPQDLQGDVHAELLVVGLVDDTHPAEADLAHDPVALRDELAGDETVLEVGARRSVRGSGTQARAAMPSDTTLGRFPRRGSALTSERTMGPRLSTAWRTAPTLPRNRSSRTASGDRPEATSALSFPPGEIRITKPRSVRVSS